jgi:hypothetical protein
MNESWGFTKFNNHPKSADELILVLIKTVAAGGNLLLNIGPKADGSIPEEQVEILKQFAKWMDVNKESIHGSRPNIFHEYFGWGLCTTKGTDIYLHVTGWEEGKTIAIPRLNNKVEKVELLGDTHRNLPWEKEGDNYLITLKGEPVFSSASVIKVTCGGDSLDINPVQLSETDGEIQLNVAYAKSSGQRMSRLRHTIVNGQVAANLAQGHSSERLTWRFNLDHPAAYRVIAECMKTDIANIQSRTLTFTSNESRSTSVEISKASFGNGTIDCGVIELGTDPSLELKVEGGRGSSIYLTGIRLLRE